MEIKAGDKVRIKSWEKLLEENSEFYEKEWESEIARGPAFVGEMVDFCGKELVVSEAWERHEEEDQRLHTWFNVVGDTNSFSFSDWMVEEVIA